MARVETLLGSASAGSPSASSRGLACGDAVYEGDLVSTEPDSRVGLMRDETYAQLGSASVVRMGLTPERALDVRLESGAVRVVDARESGPPFRLAVSNAEVALIGGDADAYAAVDGAPAVLCTRGAQCVAAVAGEAPRVAAAPATRLALPQSADEECYADVGVETALLYPPAVGTGPDYWLFPDQRLLGPEPDPCDNPGSGCNARGRGGSGPGDASDSEDSDFDDSDRGDSDRDDSDFGDSDRDDSDFDDSDRGDSDHGGSDRGDSDFGDSDAGDDERGHKAEKRKQRDDLDDSDGGDRKRSKKKGHRHARDDDREDSDFGDRKADKQTARKSEARRHKSHKDELAKRKQTRHEAHEHRRDEHQRDKHKKLESRGGGDDRASQHRQHRHQRRRGGSDDDSD